MSGAALLVGLPPNPQYRRLPVTAASFASPSVCFLEAPEQADLVSAFVDSAEARTVTSLMIGTSHDYKMKDATRYRMHDAVEALCRGSFPALESLSLGDMEKLFNGASVFGALGDITDLFAIAPKLQSLALHGNFALSRSVTHPTLRNLTVWVQEIGGTEGPLSQQTVDNLLLSNFPALADLSLQLEEWDAPDYTIPEALFAPTSFPTLTQFHIDTITPEVAERVAAWKTARNPG